jgi:hypothetical protein
MFRRSGGASGSMALRAASLAARISAAVLTGWVPLPWGPSRRTGTRPVGRLPFGLWAIRGGRRSMGAAGARSSAEGVGALASARGDGVGLGGGAGRWACGVGLWERAGTARPSCTRTRRSLAYTSWLAMCSGRRGCRRAKGSSSSILDQKPLEFPAGRRMVLESSRSLVDQPATRRVAMGREGSCTSFSSGGRRSTAFGSCSSWDIVGVNSLAERSGRL